MRYIPSFFLLHLNHSTTQPLSTHTHTHTNRHYTSSVVGHNQEGLIVYAEGFPVKGAVSLQGLVPQELQFPGTPLVDDGQLLPPLSPPHGVGHSQEHLRQKQGGQTFGQSWSLTWKLGLELGLGLNMSIKLPRDLELPSQDQR